ncbi:MAG: hypothetical protein WCC90_10535 [Methylocella sp.]
MSTAGNGLGASQDCLSYTASFNAAAQSRRDEAIDAIAPRATEKIAFGANPMNDSTVTLNGTAVTFAASPSAGQVQMGSTLAATLQNLIAALEAFVDANIMLMEYFANASNLYVEALAGGAAGNSQSPPARRLRQAEPHPARLSRMDH